MRPGPVEKAYEDVLQNLEFGIVQIFHQHPDLSDWDVLKAIENLTGYYKAMVKGKIPRHRPLNTALAQEVYDSVNAICEWRLGQNQLLNGDEGTPVAMPIEPLKPIELVACLKRIKKSLQLWTKDFGRQGYLNYVNNFFPHPPDEDNEE